MVYKIVTILINILLFGALIHYSYEIRRYNELKNIFNGNVRNGFIYQSNKIKRKFIITIIVIIIVNLIIKIGEYYV